MNVIRWRSIRNKTTYIISTDHEVTLYHRLGQHTTFFSAPYIVQLELQQNG
jgi:hypothetical protein